MSQFTKFKSKLKDEGLGAAMHATTRWLTRRAGIPYGVEPYDYIQSHTATHLHTYLRRKPEDVRQVIIVGAHMGYEVDSMLKQYPNVSFRLFEASPRYGGALKRRFSGNRRVSIFECAVSDLCGTTTFFETNLQGSGSLLKVGELAERSYGMHQGESYTVAVTSLDEHASQNGYAGENIDCLWIDVQGAEMGVLRGAKNLLERAMSVFVEVAAFESLYKGGVTLAELQPLLLGAGLTMVGLGVDPANGTGNALFIRRSHP